MTSTRRTFLPFNTPFECGLRSVSILVPAFPRVFDLQRLVAFDYLVVHTGDIGGPASLHPELPMRSAELLVRRELVERGLLLMMSRGLVVREADSRGINYLAGDFAETFLNSLESQYLVELRERASWVVEQFGDMEYDVFRHTLGDAFDHWVHQFQSAHQGLEGAS